MVYNKIINTNKTLLSYNGERFIYQASTIKLLTAMTALDHAAPDLLLTTRQAILDDVDWDVWVMNVPADTTYSLEVWLNLLLIQSYGDVADTIADGLGDSTDDAGKCLSVIIQSNQTGHRYACVYYGTPNSRTMYPENIELLEYAINAYE